MKQGRCVSQVQAHIRGAVKTNSRSLGTRKPSNLSPLSDPGQFQLCLQLAILYMRISN
jgi:hypothetical protein